MVHQFKASTNDNEDQFSDQQGVRMPTTVEHTSVAYEEQEIELEVDPSFREGDDSNIGADLQLKIRERTESDNSKQMNQPPENERKPSEDSAANFIRMPNSNSII